ncbi:translational activator for mitochondrial COX1, partial [Linderina pennispora]
MYSQTLLRTVTAAPRFAGVSRAASARRFISLKSLFAPSPKGDGGVSGGSGQQRLLVKSDDLFHPLSKSPIKEMREKGLLIQEHGSCPTCVNETSSSGTAATREPMFECPDCGYPTHCSETHW